MRLISYRHAGDTHIGARAGDKTIDLGAAYAGLAADDSKYKAGLIGSDFVEFLEGGDDAMDGASAAIEFAQAHPGDYDAPEGFELLPVVPRPTKILCIARNYAEHAAEAGFELQDHPSIFLRFAQSLIADGDPIEVPKVSDAVDWEAELAVIIGKRGKHVSQEDALDYVAGYSIFNDVSVRDYQLRKPAVQFGAGKNFDGSGPFGPEFVSADEVGDPGNLKIELFVNDEVKQSSNTANMLRPVSELIKFISEFTTLEPGDVIATGTPAGVGNFRTPPEYLKAGDTVRIELEKVGTQVNPVVDES